MKKDDEKDEKFEVRRDLEPDGKMTDHFAAETHPDFADEYEDMAEDFFKENNPGFHDLLQRVKKTDGADKGSDSEDSGDHS